MTIRNYQICVSFVFCFLTTVSMAQNLTLPEGIWRATIRGKSQEVPFLFEVRTEQNKTNIWIRNGKERLPLTELKWEGRKLTIPMHIFEAVIVAELSPDNQTLKGVYQKFESSTPYELPFQAVLGKTERFGSTGKPPIANITGKYEVRFGTNSLAVGVFEQQNSYLEGTFLTPTGDYRFLEGSIEADSLKLSCFDGMHLYLFVAKISEQGKILNGVFYSGRAEGVTWTAQQNPNAQLPDAYSLTQIKNPKVSFSFPSFRGGNLSTEDAQYKGKPLIIQVFGTWCPNCMDETQFLAQWYKNNRQRGIEVIGLDFETKNDLDYAKMRMQKVINRFGVEYGFAFAGTTSEEDRTKALPFINRVMAFPTTIFVNRKGEIAKIHTGYSGPATGKYYEEFLKEFEQTVADLLKE